MRRYDGRKGHDVFHVVQIDKSQAVAVLRDESTNLPPFADVSDLVQALQRF